jgi:hypothetical protein
MAAAVPSVRVKRIYDEPDLSDGFRVLVDRLWPPGPESALISFGLAQFEEMHTLWGSKFRDLPERLLSSAREQALAIRAGCLDCDVRGSLQSPLCRIAESASPDR